MTKALIDINCYLFAIGLLYFVMREHLNVKTRRLVVLILPAVVVLVFFFQEVVQMPNRLIKMPSLELGMLTIGNDSSFVLGSEINLRPIMLVYFLGVLVLILFSTYRALKTLVFFKKANYNASVGIFLIRSQSQQSFTFFNRIHLSEALDEDDKAIVLEHELLHVRYRHSWDLLLMQLYHAFYWINPIMFFLKKDLVHVHEYQVDQKMYAKHHKKYLKHLVASAMGVNSSQLLTSQFYNGLSLTQRTKQMKMKIENNWKLVAILPAFAAGLSFISFTNSPSDPIRERVQQDDSVYKVVEVLPEYPGGKKAMVQFLSANVKYPQQEKAKGISGTVYVGFVVQKDGQISDVKSLKKTNKAFELEAVRVIKMMPKWTPGEQNGKAVDVQYTIPIKFQLKD